VRSFEFRHKCKFSLIKIKRHARRIKTHSFKNGILFFKTLMFKAIATITGGSATAIFYGIRNGQFGVTKVKYLDSKKETYFVHVKRRFFYDELHASKTERVTSLLHFAADVNEETPPPHKELPVLFSIKPFEYEVVRYDKRVELEKKMIERFNTVQLEHQDQPYAVRELIAKESITRLVSEFK